MVEAYPPIPTAFFNLSEFRNSWLFAAKQEVGLTRPPFSSKCEASGSYHDWPETLHQNIMDSATLLRQPWKSWYSPSKPPNDHFYLWPIMLAGNGQGSSPQAPRKVDFSKPKPRTIKRL